LTWSCKGGSHGYHSLREELDTGWPWPLDAVQEWFEDLWNWISEAAYDAVRQLAEWVPEWFRDWFWDAFYALRERLSDAYYQAWDWVSEVPRPFNYIAFLFVFPAAIVYTLFSRDLHRVAEWVWSLVPDWLKGGIEWLRGRLEDVSRSLNEFLKDPVAAIQSGLDYVVTTVVKTFHEILDPVADVFREGLNAVRNALTSVFKPLYDFFNRLIAFFTQQLPRQFTSLINGISNGIGGLVESLGKLTESITSTLNNIHKFLVELPQTIHTFITDTIPQSLANAWQAATTWLNREVVEPVYNALGWLREWLIGGVRGLFSELINSIRAASQQVLAGNPQAALELLLGFAASGLAIQGILSVAGMKIFGSGLEVGELSSFLLHLFNPSMITGIIIGAALSTGLGEPLRQYYRSLFRTRLPDETDIKTWYLRGYITPDRARELLARHGYSDEFIKYVMDSWWVIPSISDLINFVVKEVITPDEFYEWAARQGLSRTWAERYWEAHWRLPSFENLREAFWRGIITEDEFRKYIVWHDYKPEPRPGISKSDLDIMNQLSYRLPGRIDARWMVRWGIIDKTQLRELVKMDGVHPDWVDKVVEAEYLNQLLDERNRVKSEAYRLYSRGLITREELEKRLREARFIEDEIRYLLQAADDAKRYYLLQLTLDYYEELMKRGMITKSQFIQELTALGVDEAFASRMADILEARSIKIDRKDYTKDERTALRSTLRTLFKEGLITEEELRQRLSDLGFTPEEIELTVERARLEYRYDFYRDILSMLKEAYRKNQITREDFLNSLLELGLSRERAEVIVAIEDYRKMPRPRPPKPAS